MNTVPKIPLQVRELPQQRLHLACALPDAPADWHVELNGFGSTCEQELPASARYLAQVEWSWAPLKGRIDAYHLSWDAGDSWTLWVSHFDLAVWKFVDPHIAACASYAGIQGADAAVLLLLAYWSSEAQKSPALDAFHWIGEEGLLGTAQLKEIARRVWTEQQLQRHHRLPDTLPRATTADQLSMDDLMTLAYLNSLPDEDGERMIGLKDFEPMEDLTAWRFLTKLNIGQNECGDKETS